ncbi:glycosyltransferase [Algoriphagus namhaensis]|uniref:Glycosyltransferase n=1 Tax=Algoriphagus namhaensis TaxID=915353 RepID=A0ABV8ARI1_9BACT
MLSFYLICTVCYILALIFLAKPWPKESKPNPVKLPQESVSLIISCRNESENIPTLLQELTAQLPYLREVILVDDGSEDDTYALLAAGGAGHPKIVVLKNPGIGKKPAISAAVLQAKGELIITSDADCIWQNGWIKELVAEFSNPKIQLVAGPVIPFRPASKKPFFELIDWASILLVTQFSFAQKKPLMCSGANLAYRKSAFEKVEGYKGNQEFLSGDDEFLLKKVLKKFSAEAVSYRNNTTSLVLTLAQPSIKALVNQRIRWSGKWRLHEEWAHSISALGAFFVQIFWISSFLLLLQGLNGVLVFVFIWLLKIGIEATVLGRVLRFYRVNSHLPTFVFTSFFHPVFVIRVALGSLGGKFVWKGRSMVRNSIFA